jgi:hypothetical protein
MNNKWKVALKIDSFIKINGTDLKNRIILQQENSIFSRFI